MSAFVHVATITAPHGIKGQFKLGCLLSSPKNIAQFPTLYNEAGEVVKLVFVSLKAKQPIASIAGVEDRNGVEPLRGMKLFVKAEDFPKAGEGEYYSHQLVGLEVRDEAGRQLGCVLAHHNFGAGDILEIEFADGETEMLPFNDNVFPEVNIEKGYLIYAPPEWID